MIISNILALCLTGSVTAQLLLSKPLLDRQQQLTSPAQQHHELVAGDIPAQQPLAPKPSASQTVPPFKAGQYTRIPQNDTTCATAGEAHWAGTVDVSDTHRLFYWFFDSRSDPASDPVVLWINGGPGGSSMMGLFNEMGPCWLPPGDSEATEPNPWAWNANASLLFIDQPAGVGFSSLAEGAPPLTVDMDGAQDFQVFLSIFFGDVFPDRAHLPIHFAAESYGGHYAPTYVRHMLASRAFDAPTAFWGNVSSLILVDAVVDFVAPSIGAYELLCSDFRGGDIVSREACEGIRFSLAECEALGRSCDLSYDGYECWAMVTFCWSMINVYYEAEVEKGFRNPYNIGIGCDNYPECSDPRKGNFTHYLNQAHVKAALGFSPSFVFRGIDWELNAAYTASRTPFKPTTGEVAAILDAHLTPGLGDVRVLVLQGNEDFVVNTPGNAWAYDNLRWSGQPEYRIARWEELGGEDVAATGFWKGTRDGRLVFVGVDGAGHTVPGDVREGSWRIVNRWIEGGWRA